MGMRDAAMTRRQESVFHCSDSRKLIASDADTDRGPADLVHKHTRRACGVGYVELVNWFTHPKPVPVRLGILYLSLSQPFAFNLCAGIAIHRMCMHEIAT